ncbi:peroxisome biogenesis protein 7-like [Alnus glutinosa]|uniref:peroxisome biogenesis protein 7-like n=1 Tax=Alnus glutinosa TaxID=3517 RepID=UPI002D781BD6|nr:peroxisome biogenesis protein 7-like [Alnus glutinosa]
MGLVGWGGEAMEAMEEEHASTPPFGNPATPTSLPPPPTIALRIWDVRKPGSTMIIPAHKFEILTCDWNKYDDCCIVTASVDKIIKVWDVRSYRVPISVLSGHGYAVRKVRFSLHRQGLMVSCSYDMTVCLWDYMLEDALMGRYDHHMEFAVGVDMSVLVEGLLASTGWDELVYVW